MESDLRLKQPNDLINPFIVLPLFGLYLVSLYSFLLFHSLVELFSIAVAFSIFIISWNARRFIDGNYLALLGVAYLFVGGIDLLHTLAYKGMGVFQGYDANLPTQLWIVARYMQSLSLLAVPLLIKKKIEIKRTFVIYLAASSILISSVFLGGFPDCFVEGVGLTSFKKASEYIISSLLLLSMILMFRNRSEFGRRTWIFLVSSIGMTIGSELAFTFYVSVYGLSNLIGHFLKVLAFYLIYKAITETSLVNPYASLFKNLKQSEERFRFLFEQAPTPYQSLDEKGRILIVNEAWLDTLGYTQEEVIGKWFGDFLTPPSREVFEQRLSRLKRKGQVTNLEYGMIRKDGSHLLISLNGKVGRDKDGRFKQTHCTFSDITEPRRMQEELRRSEARFKLLSETSGRLLASEDPQGIVNELCRGVMVHLDCQVFFNFLVDDQAGRLHLNAYAGIPEKEARKIEWLDYGVAVCGCAAQEASRIVAEDIFHTLDPRTDLVKSYGIQAYACHPLVVQGRLIGTLSFGTRNRSRFSPENLALMKTVTDQVAIAMERIRLIGELKKSKDELEVRVEERTAQLRKTNEALERSNRDLTDFAHVASHDLQEPLRKIQTFADRLFTIDQVSLGDKARDYLERMRGAAGRMQALVLDLLGYSRVTSRQDPFTRFNLKDPVEEAVADLAVLCEETQGRIEVGELPEVEGDRVQMRQLFQNLIGNGLKYRGERGPVVRVYSGSTSSDPFWEIRVEDDGIGFDECYLDKIFRPFQRLHGRSAPYPGTGMGLAICRKIVEGHGGNITAKSKPGEGATFIVSLPKIH